MIAGPLSHETSTDTLHLVSHGKSGGLGCFVADTAQSLERGTIVVVETLRGVEAGTIVGPATQRQARLLGPILAGRLLRPFTQADAENWSQQQHLSQTIFDRARTLSDELQLPLEILDVDIFFDGSQAIVQFLGPDDAGLETLAEKLEASFLAPIRFENLHQPFVPEEDHHGGCGKPDCGKTSGGSCTTCSTGGGCSSCAKGNGTDLKEYFGHLRGKMEDRQERVSLL
jgi:cell fate regulator YaaT (PSP1 superfamily)